MGAEVKEPTVIKKMSIEVLATILYSTSFLGGIVCSVYFLEVGLYRRKKYLKIIAEDHYRLYKNIKKDFENVKLSEIEKVIKDISNKNSKRLIEEAKELLE